MALRVASFATRRSLPFLQLGPLALSNGMQIRTRLSSTAVEGTAKNGAHTSKDEPSYVRPLPQNPPLPKGTPPTITTDDIEKYVQPLYSRGWGLCPILPNGNGIAVLRKRFEFASPWALEVFLADLSGYEERKKHHAKTHVFEDERAVVVSAWTHVARRPNARATDENGKKQGVTARDIHLAYALEKMFENALAPSGVAYRPRVRPEADRPKTVEELEGYE
ncbi:hypothetical protein F5148DRAFT_1320026 [Russula earlei]|uniref:Uncharacterized protein n=1 Tax=Russula earlei TaxID=71964 RepID=A0ACC0U3L0_9AGAM|nr:hypothetical protein F5148DRAFT_1320026 [Russula earlei]